MKTEEIGGCIMQHNLMCLRAGEVHCRFASKGLCMASETTCYLQFEMNYITYMILHDPILVHLDATQSLEHMMSSQRLCKSIATFIIMRCAQLMQCKGEIATNAGPMEMFGQICTYTPA